MRTHRQFSTFYLGDRFYGIDVMQVQEVTKAMPMTLIPLSAPYVKGLVNLRGQIATAIGLRDLFQIRSGESPEAMSVVCRFDDALFSILVDRIGDVIEVPDSGFEPPPDTLEPEISRFLQGVYKTPKALLSVIEVEKLFHVLSKKGE